MGVVRLEIDNLDNLDETIKTQATLVGYRKSPIDIIKDKTYMHYIMGQDLRLLIGSINKLYSVKIYLFVLIHLIQIHLHQIYFFQLP